MEEAKAHTEGSDKMTLAYEDRRYPLPPSNPRSGPQPGICTPRPTSRPQQRDSVPAVDTGQASMLPSQRPPSAASPHTAPGLGAQALSPRWAPGVRLGDQETVT